MPMSNTPTSYEQAFSGNPDGGQVGSSSTEKVGFFGATPVVKTAVSATAVTAVGTTAFSQIATSGKWGFQTSTAAIALVTRVTQLQVDVEGLITQLNTLGIV
jgi:hypothetical protein